MSKIYIGATYHHELKHISMIPLKDVGNSLYQVQVINFGNASLLWESFMDVKTIELYFNIDAECLRQIERQRKFSNDLEELLDE